MTITHTSSPHCIYHDPILKMQRTTSLPGSTDHMKRMLATPSSQQPTVFTSDFKIGTAACDDCTCPALPDELVRSLDRVARSLCNILVDFSADFQGGSYSDQP